MAEHVQLGRQFAHPYHFHPSDAPRATEPVPQGTVRAQILRSAADWSHGILLEDSIQRKLRGIYACGNHPDLNRGVYRDDQGSESLYLHRKPIL